MTQTCCRQVLFLSQLPNGHAGRQLTGVITLRFVGDSRCRFPAGVTPPMKPTLVLAVGCHAVIGCKVLTGSHLAWWLTSLRLGRRKLAVLANLALKLGQHLERLERGGLLEVDLTQSVECRV